MSRLFIQSLKTWGFQVAPKPGETWGFHVAPRPKPAAPKPAGTRGFHAVPRRPSLGNLGFPCPALDGTTGFRTLRHDGNAGFSTIPQSGELEVSMTTQTSSQVSGTWGVSKPLPKSGELAVSMSRHTLNRPRVWGTRGFHVVGPRKAAKGRGTRGVHFAARWKLPPKSVDTHGVSISRHSKNCYPSLGNAV